MALYRCFAFMKEMGAIKAIPLLEPVAAISCGIHNGQCVLDLEYEEDSAAEADANFVLTGSGGIVEVQGTAEKNAFSETQFLELLKLARKGIGELNVLQKAALGLA